MAPTRPSGEAREHDSESRRKAKKRRENCSLPKVGQVSRPEMRRRRRRPSPLELGSLNKHRARGKHKEWADFAPQIGAKSKKCSPSVVNFVFVIFFVVLTIIVLDLTSVRTNCSPTAAVVLTTATSLLSVVSGANSSLVAQAAVASHTETLVVPHSPPQATAMGNSPSAPGFALQQNAAKQRANEGKQHRKRQQKVKPASAQGSAASGNETASRSARPIVAASNKANAWRSTKAFRRQGSKAEPQTGDFGNVNEGKGVGEQRQQAQESNSLQVSITPRVGLVRVPVESNAMLKCLISSQANKFTRPFRVRWSRFMYDENVYEQIDTPAGLDEPSDSLVAPNAQAAEQKQQQLPPPPQRRRRRRQATEESNLTAPIDRQQQLRDFLQRSRQETNVINDLLIEATLSISPVKASDNASYFCSASDAQASGAENQQLVEQRARIELLALARPQVKLERVQAARDSRSALVVWSILSDGNTPIKRTTLMVKNDTRAGQLYEQRSGGADPFASPTTGDESDRVAGSSVVTDKDHQQWQKVDISGDGLAYSGALDSQLAALGGGKQWPVASSDDSDVVRASLDSDFGSAAGAGDQAGWQPANSTRPNTRASNSLARQRAHNLTGLLPGVTYQLKLAALNDMGQSSWSQLTATMPNDLPAQIQDVVVLSHSNDSITIGWRRPPWDGAKTQRYEMQLFDLNRTLTLDANTNTSGQRLRTNYMFHFVNLQPGTDYHFHIRACSRAGCSAYSSPKLLASTLDGEPDEPLDVELQCSTTGELHTAVASWLPPREPRGKLLNYTVRLEASARYRNQSGHWSQEEWTSSVETGDNHTLSWEFGSQVATSGALSANSLSSLPSSALLPNTNYSVRVCANNRSKGCGRLSAVTPKSQCFVPGELPRELPADIWLSLRKYEVEVNNQEQRHDEVTQAAASVKSSDEEAVQTLQLDYPLMSWRNGSIDCLQIVLVRLPRSFDGSNSRPLSEFLPDDPADIRLHEYIDLVAKVSGQADEQQQQRYTSANGAPAEQQVVGELDDQKRTFAYLAEELDAEGQWRGDEQFNGRRRVRLGDGRQLHCQSLWSRMHRKNSSERKDKSSGHQQQQRQLQPLDGALTEETYYTGFLRLVQVRQRKRRDSQRVGSPADEGEDLELHIKHSNYFSPARTGLRVPEVPIEVLLLSQQQLSGEEAPLGQQRVSTDLPLCRWQFIIELQSKLFGSSKACRVLSNVSEIVRKNLVGLYHSLASPASAPSVQTTNSLTRLLQQASPNGPMQVLQVGILVMVLSLSLLCVVYLLTLPAAARRRQKQRKLRKQLSEHEAGAKLTMQQHEHQFSSPQKGPPQSPLNEGGFVQQPPMVANDPLQAAAAYGHFLPTNDNDASMVRQQQPTECPIHASPEHLVQQQQQQQPEQVQRRQSVHVCLEQHHLAHGTMQQQQQQKQPQHNHNHHHNHHQQARSQYHLDQVEPTASQQVPDFARHCLTLRRNDSQAANRNSYGQQQQQAEQQQQQQRIAMTLQHGVGGGSLAASVLALAKKINKSIPLALFHAVLECRLRNGWLREEYEQLPRAAAITAQQQNGANQASSPGDGRRIKLRPQLIVSRDDSVSALISGNDSFDSSLVRLQQQQQGQQQRVPSSDNAPIERQFICAKSPLDADSVWDFWRLIYEREVGTLVMLTPNEDAHTGELRCAQYWPTCDNEETTILSPCNEHVQSSNILPAKFKIRQETLGPFDDSEGPHQQHQQQFTVRRLTLLVMATKSSENEHITGSSSAATTNGTNGTLGDEAANHRVSNSNEATTQRQDSETNAGNKGAERRKSNGAADDTQQANMDQEDEDEEEKLVIVERTLLHFQFLHWNASSSNNQAKLIKFVEFVNERHARQLQQLASPGANWQHICNQSPILVHCANGVGRSGLFVAMSLLIDDLNSKLWQQQQFVRNKANQQQPLANQHLVSKINLFQLVARLRSQRDMLLSPYRFYELLYQLTARCIPVQQQYHHQQQQPAQYQQYQLR